MDIERYKEVEAIFVEVVDVAMDQRRILIDQLTDDPLLVESVEQLLSEHDRLSNDGFMESSLLGDSFEADANEPTIAIPAMIQGYTILRVLGRGASGTVYLAKSPFPLERLVALKLINIGAGKNTLKRFQEEQRILAQLKHLGIAEVYDEGISEGGRPFTVLEYIEGESITAYCKSHHLDWRATVELIIQCCDAVAHAHQRNIIHRDLKPSNLLVTEVDGSARGKVIDFGTAKLLDPFLLMTELTVDSQFVGTLPYSSPEQLSGNETPDIRTDIHALGIVLYECLEGKHPFFESGIGLKSSIDLIMTKPVPHVKHKPELPARELDAILSQACAKAPVERYSSLIHFSEDLQNLLAGLPVHAMKDRHTYIARKFIRRHRMAMGVSAVIFAMLALMAGVAINKGIQANTHRNALRETAIRMVDDLMPMLADLSGSSEARHELASSLHERINELLLTDPADTELLLRKAHVLEYESDMLLSDDLIDESEALRIEASKMIQSLLAEDADDEEVLSIDHRRLIIKLGDIAKARRDFDAALEYYEQNHKLLLALPGDHRNGLCWSFERLSWVAAKQKKYKSSHDFAQQRIDISLELLEEKPNSPTLLYNCARAYQNMTIKYMIRKNPDKSLQHARNCLAIAKRLIAIEPDRFTSRHMELNAMFGLTRSLYFSGLTDEANEQSDTTRKTALAFANANPGRMDAIEAAWIEIHSIRLLWLEFAPQHDLQTIENELQSLIPDRPFD